jgi:hypothetical protein
MNPVGAASSRDLKDFFKGKIDRITTIRILITKSTQPMCLA